MEAAERERRRTISSQRESHKIISSFVLSRRTSSRLQSKGACDAVTAVSLIRSSTQYMAYERRQRDTYYLPSCIHNAPTDLQNSKLLFLQKHYWRAGSGHTRGLVISHNDKYEEGKERVKNLIRICALSIFLLMVAVVPSIFHLSHLSCPLSFFPSYTLHHCFPIPPVRNIKHNRIFNELTLNTHVPFFTLQCKYENNRFLQSWGNK